MSIPILEATIRLKKAEMEELISQLKEEFRKQFDYITIKELEKELRENEKKMEVLSVNGHKYIDIIYRDGKYLIEDLHPAYINGNGSFVLGYYLVKDGKPLDDRFRENEGVYVRRRG